MTPEELEAICIKEGPGMPGPKRGRAAAARVYLSKKRGQPTYRANQRRATQQEAQDAAVLCRWLNAEGAMPARTAAAAPPGGPEDVEDIIFSMLAEQNLKHLIALAHVELAQDGRIIVTSSLTPRHPEWTGLSPLLSTAAACEATIAADQEVHGLPGLVVIHTGEAAKHLQGPDGQPHSEPPAGAASHLAEILRHHGARTVRWLSLEAQTGANETPDPYTWASWHYDMPPELHASPEGWTLSRNLMHTWMIQDTSQAIALAKYALTNAEAAVSMASQARIENREQAAQGAALAAKLMADRGQTCIDQGTALIRQGAPSVDSPQELDELAARARRIRRDAQALPAPRPARAQRWYADACHRLLRHKSCTTMVPKMLRELAQARDDYHRYVMTLSCQQICAWPSDNIYDIPEDYPVGQEPDPDLARTIRLCDEEMNAVRAHILAPVNDAAVTEISPGLEPFPDLTRRLRGTLVPTVGCDGGFEYAELGPEDQAVGMTHISSGWTGFYWEGRRIFKGAAEAYPPGYPTPLAVGHALQLELRFAAMVSDDPDADYNANLQPFYTMYATAAAAAQNGWHTIGAPQIAQLDSAARAGGLSPEEIRAVFTALTDGDRHLAAHLAYNSDLDSVALDPEQEPAPPLQLSNERAGRIRGAALAAGFPARHAELIGPSR